MSRGFETVLEPAEPQRLSEQENQKLLKDYAYAKSEIDELNKMANLDQTSFIAQVKRSIYGKCGFEIVVDKDLVPERLLPLESTSLKPKLNDLWELTGFGYEGKSRFYQPEEVLYFITLALEADCEGQSGFEPIIDVCNTRYEILRKDLREISMSLWPLFLFLRADTTGLSRNDGDQALQDLVKVIKHGKRVVANESIEGQVFDMEPDILGLASPLDKPELMILANIKTLGFLGAISACVQYSLRFIRRRACGDQQPTGISHLH